MSSIRLMSDNATISGSARRYGCCKGRLSEGCPHGAFMVFANDPIPGSGPCAGSTQATFSKLRGRRIVTIQRSARDNGPARAGQLGSP